MLILDWGSLRRTIARIALALSLSLFLISCGGSELPSNQDPTLLTGDFPPGSVRTLTFDSTQNEIIFPQLSGREKFSLVLFASNADEGPFNIRLLKNQISSKNLETILSPLPPSPLLKEGEDNETDQTSIAHETLRLEEEKLSGLRPYTTSNHDSNIKNLSSSEASCFNGNGKIIKVLSSLSNTSQYSTTCGVKIQASEHAIYYVDDIIFENYNLNFFRAAIEEFESKIATERALLGQESDVNKDGHFSVYFTPRINQLGQSIGGFITGYFFGGDLFSQSDIPSSNQEEIIYVVVPDPQGQYGQTVSDDFWQNNLGTTVLTHEYQHMINYNYKVFLNDSGGELPWINEGLSHLMEDLKPSLEDNLEDLSLNALSKILEKTSVENPSRVAIYLKDPALNNFFSGAALGQRGGAYLFFRYLYEQANLGRYPNVPNGQQLLKELIQNPLKGTENLERSTGLNFTELLQDFYATLRISNGGINFSTRYNFTGICLTCTQEDGRGTLLNGVSSLKLDLNQSDIESDQAIFYELDGAQLLRNDSTLKIGLDSRMEAGGVLIRTE